MSTASQDARMLALPVLQAVLERGESLTQALTRIPMESTQRALAVALCYGVLRGYYRLQALLAKLLRQPLRRRDADLRLLLLMGLYQLEERRVPDYAAVSETVNAAQQLGKDWAKGLLNAVLRNFIRQREKLLTAIESDSGLREAYPEWLWRLLREDWPQHWHAIMVASNRQAPMVLRVNLNKITRADYLRELDAREISGQRLPRVDTALRLERACDVGDLPGFAQGWVSVQDAGAQLAAVLLDAQPGERILDACAAPGGKTGHVLERQPAIKEMWALDSDAQRLSRVADNLQRIQPQWREQVRLQQADATRPEVWWDGEFFDRILLDVPCSATGVIRRHPDIKLLRRYADVAALVKVQRQLLHALWPMLKPGGVLLYVTCSVLAAENSAQIAAFLDAIGQTVKHREMALPYAVACTYGYQILPGQGEMDMDGFYYAALCKTCQGEGL